MEMLEEFPTTLEEDEEMLRELEEAEEAAAAAAASEEEIWEEEAVELEQDEDEEEDDEFEDVGPMQYVTAVRYRVTVKRLLRQFLDECLELGVQPSEY